MTCSCGNPNCGKPAKPPTLLCQCCMEHPAAGMQVAPGGGLIPVCRQCAAPGQPMRPLLAA